MVIIPVANASSEVLPAPFLAMSGLNLAKILVIKYDRMDDIAKEGLVFYKRLCTLSFKV